MNRNKTIKVEDSVTCTHADYLPQNGLRLTHTVKITNNLRLGGNMNDIRGIHLHSATTSIYGGVVQSKRLSRFLKF